MPRRSAYHPMRLSSRPQKRPDCWSSAPEPTMAGSGTSAERCSGTRSARSPLFERRMAQHTDVYVVRVEDLLARVLGANVNLVVLSGRSNAGRCRSTPLPTRLIAGGRGDVRAVDTSWRPEETA